MPIKWIDGKTGLDFLGLAWLSTVSLLWLTFRGPAWLPALIILVFIGIKIRAGYLTYRRTPLDYALASFLIMAVIGVWAAYDRETALDKFWMLLLAVLVYYEVVSQPKQNSQILIGWISLLGVLLSLHFLFYYDWLMLPVDFQIITRIGLFWMAMRPELQGHTLTPNITAGILAVFFPFTLAFVIKIWQQRTILNWSWLLMVIAISFAGVQALAIFMTSSRGAWFALALGLGLWMIRALSKEYKLHLTRQWKLALIAGGIVIGILASAMILIQIDNPARILDLAPGIPTGQSRRGIDRLTIRLIRDFLFTGGGLGSFPGLFSQYMLVIPNLLFKYSHNLYLDIALEQGLPGLLALLLILGGSVILLLRAPANGDTPPELSLLRHAALAGLAVMAIHGVIDDALYGERGTPFIWLVAGLAVFIQPPIRPKAGRLPTDLDQGGKPVVFQRQAWLYLTILTAVIVAIYSVFSWRNLAAVWLANLGALHMARVQLTDFPMDEWSGREFGDSLVSAQNLFESAISLDPTNQTALYRLGLIALEKQDFQTAIDYLNAAYRQDKGHRGVIKHLGYAYVWGRQYEKAQTFLSGIPEARSEMQTYSLWWVIHKRPDLSQNAEEMARRLANVNSIRPVALSSRWVIP